MSATLAGVLLIILSSAIEGFAQVCLKRSAIVSTAKSRWIVLGVLLFIFEALFYTGALQRLDISTAYPLGALSFVSVTLFSRWMLNETVDLRRWIGLTLIVCGAALVVAQS
ncbi:MAG: EamA family transporter [Betaproteobacteria bacterium]|nr:EamA family transporter [Betaproteobacteria bacterium]